MQAARQSRRSDSMTDDRILDVRAVPHAGRHTQIFEAFEALDAGAGFELVNDHDPKPLYYQFAAERPGAFTWDSLEEGPEVWRARLGRPAAPAVASAAAPAAGTRSMTARLDYRTELPDAIEAMSGLEKVVESSTLEPLLLELVKQRASQINGCAYCLDMHTKDAVASVRTSSGSTSWPSGARRRSTRPESGPPWPGPRRSRCCPRPAHPTTSTRRWLASSSRPSRSR